MLSPYIEEIIGDHQHEFRRNRSTTDQIFGIRQILKKKRDNNETVHQLFVDFEKAYDSVRWEVLYYIFIQFGVPMKLVRLINMCLNKTYSKVRISKYLSGMFPIQNGLKHGHALLPLFFYFALEYTIRKVQENQVGLKLNGTYQLMVYADDVNLLANNRDTIKKNTETLIDANKEVSIEVSAEKTNYMLLSPDQNAGQNHDKMIINRSFENVAQFKPTVTNQNLIQEESKRRLNFGNACYRSVQNFLSSRLLPTNVKIKIYKIMILPVVLYGCETWSLILREEHRLRVFENRVLRRVFGSKGMK
jgi:hypothetical protein